MRAQRDVYEREIEVERAELEEMPKEEMQELAFIYQRKGFTRQEARAVAERIISNPEVALATLAREELGLDPSQLGYPWMAAISSFLAFGLGAVIPLLPNLVYRRPPCTNAHDSRERGSDRRDRSPAGDHHREEPAVGRWTHVVGRDDRSGCDIRDRLCDRNFPGDQLDSIGGPDRLSEFLLRPSDLSHWPSCSGAERSL